MHLCENWSDIKHSYPRNYYYSFNIIWTPKQGLWSALYRTLNSAYRMTSASLGTFFAGCMNNNIITEVLGIAILLYIQKNTPVFVTIIDTGGCIVPPQLPQPMYIISQYIRMHTTNPGLPAICMLQSLLVQKWSPWQGLLRSWPNTGKETARASSSSRLKQVIVHLNYVCMYNNYIMMQTLSYVCTHAL